MKVFIIGGTGLLGSEAAKVLIERGHEVTAIALPPVNRMIPMIFCISLLVSLCFISSILKSVF